MRHSICGLTLLVLVVGCARESPAPRQPETVLLHGKIFTGSATEFAEALLVRGIGSPKLVRPEGVAREGRSGCAANRSDGSVGDSRHQRCASAHGLQQPEHTALQFEGMDPPCALALERVRDARPRSPLGEADHRCDWSATAFFDQRVFTAQALDRLAPEHAVILHTWTPHAALLNRSAVKMFAVPDLRPAGRRFLRKGSPEQDDDRGQPACRRTDPTAGRRRAGTEPDANGVVDRRCRGVGRGGRDESLLKHDVPAFSRWS